MTMAVGQAGRDVRAAREVEAVYRISQAVVHHHDESELLREVLSILESEMDMQNVTLTLRRQDTDIFDIEAASGLTREERERGHYKLGEGITGQVARSRQPAVVPDVSKDPDFLGRAKARGSGHTGFICVPIVHHRRVIGTISVDRRNPTADLLARDLALLQLVASVLAEAVASMREQKEERASLLAENTRLRRQLGDRYRPAAIIGNAGVMQNLYNQVAQVADSQATVLIRGESGTGKELVARALHHGSARSAKPFVSVNLAALPETLIESELFGHEKGAFTGAEQQRRGRFELADGGSLFLDEIGDISPAVQVRLLRVLQERCFERVGGSKTIHVDVRVIGATSRDLETAMKENRFRGDLYYRLNVFPLHLPPLRERRADILLLAEHFLQKYCKQYDRDIKRISTPAINMMMEYHWPGNVRELENCMERAVLSSTDNVIHAWTLPPSLQTGEQTGTSILPGEGASLATLVDSYERELIVDALKKCGGNASAAARLLRTTKRIVNYKIHRLQIHPERYQTA